jgi:hypothetical protein
MQITQGAEPYGIPPSPDTTKEIPTGASSTVLFTDCTFNGNGNGYIHHQYNDSGMGSLLEEKCAEIRLLKEALSALTKHNQQLLELISYLLKNKTVY